VTLEQRGERLVITSLPIQDMALLSLGIPLDEPAQHADLLLSVSLLLFEAKGPDFFLPKLSRKNS